jgi:riboflavin kinase/FMN adenylyltransferase
MFVSAGITELPPGLKGSTVAIGNFDGVHKGHQQVIARTRAIAADLGAPSGIVLFDPHPRAYFSPGKAHFTLTPLSERLRLLADLGLDVAVVLEFDSALAAMPAEAFIEGMLVRDLAVRHIVVGYDFMFGKGRTGSPALLKAWGDRLGFGVTVIEPVADGGEAFSSSRVRRLLRDGDVAGAAAVLGRNWRVIGKVVSGAGRGTGLGFPTANIRLEQGQELRHGIYAARVHVGGMRHDAAAYLGTRPTFDNGHPLLEVFLFDFDGDLYGHEIAVEMVDYLRADQAFATIDALKAQMEIDCRNARECLRSDERKRLG